MRILTYKRTHVGDPDGEGTFGVHNCMGQVRDLHYDAVIGVGGIGAEARSWRIDGKLTWVGIGPRKSKREWKHSVVSFDTFVLLDDDGPPLVSIAPHLARRMYEGRVRYVVGSYSPNEQSDAEGIVQWALRAAARGSGKRKVSLGAGKVHCVCKRRKSRASAC